MHKDTMTHVLIWHLSLSLALLPACKASRERKELKDSFPQTQEVLIPRENIVIRKSAGFSVQDIRSYFKGNKTALYLSGDESSAAKISTLTKGLGDDFRVSRTQIPLSYFNHPDRQLTILLSDEAQDSESLRLSQDAGDEDDDHTATYILAGGVILALLAGGGAAAFRHFRKSSEPGNALPSPELHAPELPHSTKSSDIAPGSGQKVDEPPETASNAGETANQISPNGEAEPPVTRTDEPSADELTEPAADQRKEGVNGEAADSPETNNTVASNDVNKGSRLQEQNPLSPTKASVEAQKTDPAANQIVPPDGGEQASAELNNTVSEIQQPIEISKIADTAQNQESLDVIIIEEEFSKTPPAEATAHGRSEKTDNFEPTSQTRGEVSQNPVQLQNNSPARASTPQTAAKSSAPDKKPSSSQRRNPKTWKATGDVDSSFLRTSNRPRSAHNWFRGVNASEKTLDDYLKKNMITCQVKLSEGSIKYKENNVFLQLELVSAAYTKKGSTPFETKDSPTITIPLGTKHGAFSETEKNIITANYKNHLDLRAYKDGDILEFKAVAGTGKFRNRMVIFDDLKTLENDILGLHEKTLIYQPKQPAYFSKPSWLQNK